MAEGKLPTVAVGERNLGRHSFSLSRKNKVTPYQGKRKRRKVHRGSRNHGVENI